MEILFCCLGVLKVGFKTVSHIAVEDQRIYVGNLGFVSLLHLNFIYDL